MTVKTTPFWWEDAGAPHSPPEAPLPREVDALVIGAGLTGLSAARTLAKNGRSVLCLDAGAPGMGASSRNGGMLGGGHRLSLSQLRAQFGEDAARSIMQEANIDSTAFARSLITEEGIDCDHQPVGRFRAFWRNGDYEPAARALDELRKVIPIEAEMVPPGRVHEEIASTQYRGGVALAFHAGLNPAKWARGLMDAAMRAGAVVQGNTPVLSLSPEGAGFVAQTPRGPVRPGQALLATNGYTQPQFADHKRRIIPIPSYLVATEVLGQDAVRALIPRGRMIVETRERHCYFRPSPDGERIVFGGRAALVDVPEAFAQSQMRGLITQVFPQLKGVGLSHSWRGYTGFSFGYLPNIGQIDGVWHAMGYSGNGNGMAPYLGHKAALQMIGDSAGETAFSLTGLPARWWRPTGWPWFLPFADAMFRLRDLRGMIGRGRGPR